MDGMIENSDRTGHMDMVWNEGYVWIFHDIFEGFDVEGEDVVVLLFQWSLDGLEEVIQIRKEQHVQHGLFQRKQMRILEANWFGSLVGFGLGLYSQTEQKSPEDHFPG